MTIQAAVRYLSDEWKARPYRAFIYSKETRHRNTAKREVTITDARPLIADGTLEIDTHGLAFCAYEPSVRLRRRRLGAGGLRHRYRAAGAEAFVRSRRRFSAPTASAMCIATIP